MYMYKCSESLPFGANGINLINEHNGWSMFFCYTKQFSYQLGSISLQLTKQLLLMSFSCIILYQCSPQKKFEGGGNMSSIVQLEHVSLVACCCSK